MDLNNEKSLVLSKKVYQLINRLEENLKCRSPIQQNRENQAQEIYKVMANPTMDNLKGTIWMNLIKKNVAMTDNINLAMKSYGLDVW